MFFPVVAFTMTFGTSRKIDYGTAMKVNMGVEHKNIMSYDVLMDSAASMTTLKAKSVGHDAHYACRHHSSSDRADQRGASAEENVFKEGSRSKRDNGSKEESRSSSDEESSSKEEKTSDISVDEDSGPDDES